MFIAWEIIVVIFVCCLNAGVHCACESGWHAFKDKCFYFSNDKRNWRGAVQQCKTLGGRLAELKDFETNDFVKHHLDLKYLLHEEQRKHDHYIGLSDLDRTGTWKWEGSGTTAVYTDWTEGEPSGGIEHCAVLWGFMDFWWNDEDCSKEFQYVCESSSGGQIIDNTHTTKAASLPHTTAAAVETPQPSSSTVTSCKTGWETFRNKCYLFSSDKKSWNEAVQYCKSQGGRLAEIKDFDTNEYLKHYLNLKYLFHTDQTKHNFFIGLSDQAQTGVWKWEGSGNTAEFTDWTDGEPSGDPEHCVVLWGYIGYWWNDEQCQNAFQYICEIDKVSPAFG